MALFAKVGKPKTAKEARRTARTLEGSFVRKTKTGEFQVYKRTKTGGYSPMPKRRKATTRRRSFKKVRRSSRGISGDVSKVVGGAAYGAAREYLSNLMRPLSDRIPVVGDYGDEVVLGALSWLLMKGKLPLLKQIPISREIGKAGLYIESARVGSTFGSMIPINGATAPQKRETTLIA
jgi:hypothetical protein